jgi:hypothetical protein
MTISTLILVLLLTFGAASALDRFVQSHWLHEALTRVRLWGRDTGWERTRKTPQLNPLVLTKNDCFDRSNQRLG